MSENRESGMFYSPRGEAKPVVSKGMYKVGVIGLDHGHIYGMCSGLKEAGADIVKVYDPDVEKSVAFKKEFVEAEIVKSEDDILEDPEIQLVASAAIPVNRFEIGSKTVNAGKDFFSDKPPFTTRDQLEEAKKLVEKTGRKWFVYYSERLHVEAAVYAEQLIKDGAIGEVMEIRGWGPHRIGLYPRPDWFYEKDKIGGIITDIGSHQLEQILTYANCNDARLVSSRVGNLYHSQYPTFEDFGDATFITDNGIPCYVNVDWFTPNGLGTWGDGRILVIGSKGYIELRKYIDVAAENTPDHVILVDEEGEYHYKVHGKVGYPYFGAMILDSINRSENAIKQSHIFKAIELALEAEEKAIRIERA